VNNCLFIIDPQKDFMPGGALGVPGADQDMVRLSTFIKDNAAKIDKIIVTLDSHNLYHIAHPVFWINDEGENPAPFTTITVDDLDDGEWKTADPFYFDVACSYLAELEAKGLSHTIWPPHCLVGTSGHGIDEALMEALLAWEGTLKKVNYEFKGTIAVTEHFGAFRAEVPMSVHADTFFNRDLFDTLFSYDKIIIAGEASSHCVASTIFQMIEHVADYTNLKKQLFDKLIYLKDCCSPVPGFEDREQVLIDFFNRKEMIVTDTSAVVGML